MTEAALWLTTKKHLQSNGHIVRVENMATPGMPDVNYCFGGIEGWVELKEIVSWPKRPGTIVRVDHFTHVQRNWIARRCLSGGRVFVLARVLSDRTWLLFSGQWASENLGTVTRKDMIDNALVFSKHRFPISGVLEALLGRES